MSWYQIFSVLFHYGLLCYAVMIPTQSSSPDNNNNSTPPPTTTTTAVPPLTTTSSSNSDNVNVTYLGPVTPATGTPTPPESSQILPPLMPQNYHMTLKVYDGTDKSYFTILEHGEGSRLALSLVGPSSHHPVTNCLINLATGTGHIIRGVRCHRSSALPPSCFCGGSRCAPFVPAATLLSFLREDPNTQSQEVGVAGVELWSWKTTRGGATVQVTFTQAENHAIVPSAFTIKGAGRVFGLSNNEIHLVYSVVNFRGWEGTGGSWDRVGSPFLPPRGVFCPPLEPPPPGRRLPQLPDHFSLTMETVATWQHHLSYEELHFDYSQKVTAYRWRPHLHTLPAMLFAAFPFAQTLPGDVMRVVHDFRTGLQYEINESSGNCTIEPLLEPTSGTTNSDAHQIRLVHAQELLEAEPENVEYAGMRELRGVLADAWITEKGVSDGRYTTMEVYFAHENWTVEVEGVNRVQGAPLGIATYSAPVGNQSAFTEIALTHFLHYNAGHPLWSHFEIAPCLPKSQRLFLRLEIVVSFDRLVRFSLEAAQDSLRRAISGLAGVSPLRVTDLFISGSSSDAPRCGVWFVLLENPSASPPTPQLPLADAFQLLRSLIENHDVLIRLDLGAERMLDVEIYRGSLTTISEVLHPATRQRAFRYNRATYTAGSMAGLGFAMGVIGVALGLLVGFLLWRRQQGIPYRVAE